MKLIKTINTNLPQQHVVEDGGTGAGAIGGLAMPLFSTLVKRASLSTTPVAGPYSDKPGRKIKAKKKLNVKEAFDRISENIDAVGGQQNNATSMAVTSDTIARLKSLETRELADKRDVVVFGLEDDDGSIVRVSVKPEQAGEFEQALQQFINAKQTEETVPEIAELLFSMRDHFDIIDVVWPEVQEDEEQIGDVDTGDQPDVDPEDVDVTPELEAPVADTSQVTDLLTQVIDMMKADAGARYAEAKAREAEAKTKEANAIVSQTMARVKKEEQYLDMEAEQKAKKEEERETKRLAQLAKWQRGVADETGQAPDEDMQDVFDQGLPQQRGIEDEEFRKPSVVQRPAHQPRMSVAKKRVAPRDIASFILKRVQ